ncbi:MAG: arylsulfatase [Candidatus Methanocomedens sp.]|nr:MAG: arylsulfatase [ANME-2 cluster archaeon]
MKNLLLTLLVVMVMFSSCTETEPMPPNIVLIFTDDQGYADLTCFGSETINTPNIDHLAASGMKFTDFHVAASVCTPSRAALLTGCYPNRISLPNVLFPNGAWGSKNNIGINPEEETIAELLKEKGYATAMAGKWHLGHMEMFLPLQHGFDQYFGIPYSNDMNRGNLPLMKDNEVFEIEPDQALLTKRYTESCVEFINRQAGVSPFFVYLAHTMPHIPIYASEQFEGKSEGGLYGDVIEEIDWSVGEIINALRENKVLNNTLVIFTSDNGPWLSFGNHGGSADPLRGGKFDVFEGGFRVPCVMFWQDVILAGAVCDELVTTMDILPTISQLSGSELPEKKYDGVNILPLLKGEEMENLSGRYFYYYAGRELKAIRKGEWKYLPPLKYGVVTEPGQDGVNGKSEKFEQDAALYNLEEDIAESNNLIQEYPEIANELKEALEAFDTVLINEARPIGIFEE